MIPQPHEYCPESLDDRQCNSGDDLECFDEYPTEQVNNGSEEGSEVLNDSHNDRDDDLTNASKEGDNDS